ncbi:MAG: aminotransferase class V-fold PLP-dependent enzyme [Acetobacteraceae bacterium]|nr:aminotransferase class V-fold PLP-dependent enzyme [Acetobacteraceae bacterium]
MTETPLFNPRDFAIPDGVAHVCAGGETACLRGHDAALSRYLRDKSTGMPGRVAQEAQIARARAGIARLWNTDTGSIGFVSNVAEGVSIVAESLDFRNGANIVIDANEYPSVAGPFLKRAAVRQARGTGPDRFAGLVDAQTRVIGVSHVSYLTGERLDLIALRKLADSVGALLIVDFTQAAGYLPIEAAIADFAFSACYKWLLGITGVAVAFWNRARQPNWAPISAGWYSFEPGSRGYDTPPRLRADALRFTRGNPAHAPVYVLAEALDYLAAFDMRDVQAHVQGLTTDMLERLRGLQIPTLTPSDPARHGASVCVPSPQAQAIVGAMAEQGVMAWNGQGRVRFSFHGYNSRHDVDRATAALRSAWA